MASGSKTKLVYEPAEAAHSLETRPISSGNKNGAIVFVALTVEMTSLTRKQHIDPMDDDRMFPTILIMEMVVLRRIGKVCIL